MPSTTMDASQWVLVSGDAEVMVVTGRTTKTTAPDSADQFLADFNQSLSWTLPRFQHRFSQGWVAGQVVLRSDSLEFRPRQPDMDLPSSTPILVRLCEVSSVEIEAKVFTKLVRVQAASGQQLLFRCRQPQVFAEQLRMAAGAARVLAMAEPAAA